MFFGPRLIKSRNHITKNHPKMMCTTFNDYSSVTIISFLSTNNTSDENDSTAFCNDLSSLVQHTLKHNVFIIKKHIMIIHAKSEIIVFCLHNATKRNGKYAAEFSFKNRVVFLNTKFKKGRKIMYEGKKKSFLFL